MLERRGTVVLGVLSTSVVVNSSFGPWNFVVRSLSWTFRKPTSSIRGLWRTRCVAALLFLVYNLTYCSPVCFMSYSPSIASNKLLGTCPASSLCRQRFRPRQRSDRMCTGSGSTNAATFPPTVRPDFGSACSRGISCHHPTPGTWYARAIQAQGPQPILSVHVG